MCPHLNQRDSRGKQYKIGGRRAFVSTVMGDSYQAIVARWRSCSLLRPNLEETKGELGRILNTKRNQMELRKEQQIIGFDLEDKCRVKGGGIDRSPPS
jgi:hypothetical protein